ncbi:hypothetical protein N7510_005079 [Penicillium lagena]|uniref:uncharacterized protein n=1 Tax=Penicillium lagena TaxID=94218 RepID=UPI0025422E83|nr:uncharacterized protein N7510_005079 [Penicillium lagena]KAJ5621095.1 hypothetical protein N7510_005079 [Penicillium lagena]
MHSYIRPHQFVALRLPSDVLKIVKLIPDTTVNLGKYGLFPANQIIGRPFYMTYEIDNPDEKDGHVLRAVSAAELHAEALIADADVDGEGEGLEQEDGTPMRTNRETIDDSSTQRLTVQEIEELKKTATGAGREIVEKILQSHSALDQKTAFSLAKYTLRKRKKFIKRFTIFPMDVSLLTSYILEGRDAARTLELRDEHIGLLGCLANVHHGGNLAMDSSPVPKPNSRYFVVDDTGGLVVAAMAERMGILYPRDEDEGDEDEQQPTHNKRPRQAPMSASGNTITVVHSYSQPNLSLLKYFGYDTDKPDESHPLHTHLKSISWMQLIDPMADPIYGNEPPVVPASELESFKQSRRSAYFHKRNRWEKVKGVVDEARDGGFDGLIVSALMEPAGILKHLVPLLAGSGSVAVYSPTIEPLTQLMDMYSTARRTAFIHRKREIETQGCSDAALNEEFELDPTILLPPNLHTLRVRQWQVLPGRTHPLMSSRGGAEGYLFHGLRVFPATQTIQAAGAFRKRRKVTSTATPGSDSDVEMASTSV